MVNWKSSLAVELLLYAPKRPVVDLSVVFLWTMAVGTILCASCWSEFTGSQQSDERYNELSPKVVVQPSTHLPKLLNLKLDYYHRFLLICVIIGSFVRYYFFIDSLLKSQVFTKIYL